VENPKASEVRALKDLKNRLVRDFKLIEIRLFGSRARGDSRPDSDMDVLIVLEDCDWRTRLAVFDACTDVGLNHGIFIAPVLYLRSEFESSLTRATDFYQNVIRESLVV